jgi:hypothetical protein
MESKGWRRLGILKDVFKFTRANKQGDAPCVQGRWTRKVDFQVLCYGSPVQRALGSSCRLLSLSKMLREDAETKRDPQSRETKSNVHEKTRSQENPEVCCLLYNGHTL